MWRGGSVSWVEEAGDVSFAGGWGVRTGGWREEVVGVELRHVAWGGGGGVLALEAEGRRGRYG